MKRIVLPCILLCIVAASLKAQDNKGSNPQEKKVLKLVNSLPEIKAENNYRKKHKFKRLLQAYIQNTPSKDKKDYSVSISEDSGFQLFTYDWYRVNPKTYVITYDDMITGKTISLKEWRKNKRKQAGHKPGGLR